MFWSVIGLIGGGSFIVNAFGVLTNPICDTVGFGGGSRVVQATGYPAGTGMSGEFSETVDADEIDLLTLFRKVEEVIKGLKK